MRNPLILNSNIKPFSIGFYGVTYNIGFRDDFNPSTHEIVKLVSELEARIDPANAIKVFSDMKAIAERTSHMYVILS